MFSRGFGALPFLICASSPLLGRLRGSLRFCGWKIRCGFWVRAFLLFVLTSWSFHHLHHHHHQQMLSQILKAYYRLFSNLMSKQPQVLHGSFQAWLHLLLGILLCLLLLFQHLFLLLFFMFRHRLLILLIAFIM